MQMSATVIVCLDPTPMLVHSAPLLCALLVPPYVFASPVEPVLCKARSPQRYGPFQVRHKYDTCQVCLTFFGVRPGGEGGEGT
jgi:hypothetical protein